MGKVVSAYATSHILFSPKGVEEQASRVVAGMKELGRRAKAALPDVLLLIVNDHMLNFNLAIQPPFCVGVADRYVAWGDLDIPKRPFPGHRDFGEGLVRHAAESGFDLAKAEELSPDHGVTLPLFFIKPWGAVPTVPLYININMDPVPSPSRCCKLAETIGEFIEMRRPPDERVAVVGSGGLSHWLRIPGMGSIACEFDQQVIDTVISGRASDIAQHTIADLVAKAGNGGLEIINWMMMAVIARERKGEKIYYEPIAAWQTGMGCVAVAV